MNRLLRVLLLAILLGPQVGTMVVPPEEVCQETSDCCTPAGVCNVTCVTCACCMSRLTSLSSAVTIAAIETPAGAATTFAGSVALPLRSSDILHVPKSI